MNSDEIIIVPPDGWKQRQVDMPTVVSRYGIWGRSSYDSFAEEYEFILARIMENFDGTWCAIFFHDFKTTQVLNNFVDNADPGLFGIRSSHYISINKLTLEVAQKSITDYITTDPMIKICHSEEDLDKYKLLL